MFILVDYWRISIRLMSPMKIFLQVILCTDGAANVGLGLLDGRFKITCSF